MSQGEQTIVCRRCGETIPVEGGSCPHCGASIRNSLAMFALIGVGTLILGGSVLSLSQLWLYGALGAAMVATGGYLLYDKRDRTRDAQSVSDDVFESE